MPILLRKTTILAVFFLSLHVVIFGQKGLIVQNGGTVKVPFGSSIFVIDNVNLNEGSTLKNAGNVTIYKSNSVSGNFIDSSSVAYNYGTGKFIFSGTVAQNIGSINVFEQLEVANSINLLSDIKANQWNLRTGKVSTGNYKAVVTSAAASAITTDAPNINFANSWFNGKVQRFVTPSTVNNYQFPVGDAVKVNLLEMDNLTANPLLGVSDITASFGLKPGNDAGLNVYEGGTYYTSVNNGGVWYLTPNSNPTGGKYDLKLHFNGFTGLADNSFGILRRPDASTSAGEWMVPAGGVLSAMNAAGRLVAAGYARRNNISTFSQLGIGTSAAALPLQLLNFNAIKKDNAVLLQWATANEANTSHFEIYRGAKTVTLQYLNKVSAGTTANNYYSFTDANPLKGVSYYQLKMIDKNAEFKLGPTAKINFDEQNSISVYPNPIVGNILVVGCKNAKSIAQAKLVSVDGKQLFCSFTPQTSNQLVITLPVLVTKGSYTLKLTTKVGEILNTKILIQ
jgi:hypothetical protein